MNVEPKVNINLSHYNRLVNDTRNLQKEVDALLANVPIMRLDDGDNIQTIHHTSREDKKIVDFVHQYVANVSDYLDRTRMEIGHENRNLKSLKEQTLIQQRQLNTVHESVKDNCIEIHKQTKRLRILTKGIRGCHTRIFLGRAAYTLAIILLTKYFLV